MTGKTRGLRGLARRGARALTATMLGGVAMLGAAHAITIEGAVTALTDGRFEIVYEVDNTSLDEAVQEFSLFFDPAVFEPVADEDVSAPGDWDPVVFGPEPVLGFDDIIIDFLDLSGSGVALGSSVSGFAVVVTLLADSFPDRQDFQIIDPMTFSPVAFGSARLSVDDGPGGEVPIPPAALLFILPAAALCRQFKKGGTA